MKLLAGHIGPIEWSTNRWRYLMLVTLIISLWLWFLYCINNRTCRKDKELENNILHSFPLDTILTANLYCKPIRPNTVRHKQIRTFTRLPTSLFNKHKNADVCPPVKSWQTVLPSSFQLSLTAETQETMQ